MIIHLIALAINLTMGIVEVKKYSLKDCQKDADCVIELTNPDTKINKKNCSRIDGKKYFICESK